MLRRFWNSQDGNFAVMLAITSVPVLAVVGGALDVANTYAKASKLQNSLDATALAIASNYSPDMAAADMNQQGKDILAANFFGENAQDADLQASGALSNFKVEVDPTQDTVNVSSKIVSPSFLRGFPDWRVTRSASARVMGGMPACMLALNSNASAAIKLQGNTDVSLNGCVVASNSKAADSISRGGSASLKAECALAVGQTSGLSGSYAKLACGTPLERQIASLDPLRNVNPPTDGCSGKNFPTGGGTKNLSPGVYCGEKFDGTITLAAGTYVLRDTSIKLTGSGSLTGQGVTIFLLGSSGMTVNANQTVNLSPPTSGPYAGITIFQGRDNTQELKINGGSASKLSGFVYAPNAHIFFAGNSASGSSDCLRLVGDTIEMTGSSAIQSDCKAQLGGRTMTAGRFLALVQ